MADDTVNSATIKNLTALDKAITAHIASLKSSTAALEKAGDKLSNGALDKLTKSTKELLKQQGLLSDETADQIKDWQSLRVALDKLEKQADDLRKAEEAAEAAAKAEIKQKAADAKEAAKILADWRKQKLEEIDLTEESAASLKDNVEATRKHIKATTESYGSANKFAKGLGESWAGLKKQAIGLAEFGFAIGQLKKGLIGGYEQLNRLASHGMVGAMYEIGKTAPLLKLSNQEFENMIQANRQLVNTLGGGTEGIAKFADTISDVGDQLKFLGKDNTKAAERFVRLSAKGGITPKDGALFKKNMEQTTAQFAKFNKQFGDTYEEYGDLMDSLQDEEQTRNRLNGLSKEQGQQEMQAIRLRAGNLKDMGLTNQQLTEFNSKINAIIDPRKNDLGERAKQAAMAKTAYQVTQQTLANSGNADDQKQAAEMLDNQKAFFKAADLEATGTQKQLADYLQSQEGASAARAYSAGLSASDQLSPAANIARNTLVDGGGNFSSTVDQLGKRLQTARLQDKDKKGMTQAQRDAMDANNSSMQEPLGKVGTEAFDKLTAAVEGLTSALGGPLGQLVTGIGSAAFALTGMGKILKTGWSILRGGGAAAEAAGALGEGAVAAEGAGAAVAGGIGLAGGAALAASGAAGYALGNYVVAPKIDEGLSAMTGSSTSLGSWLYDKMNPNDPSKGINAPVPVKGGKISTPATSGASNAAAGASSASDRKKSLEAALDKQGITDPSERAMFMSQMGVESDNFKTMNEYGSASYFSKYDGRMGNTAAGDGAKYHGRGYIQLTGKDNYKKYGDLVGVDLVNNPDMAADPTIAAQIAIAYWKNQAGGKIPAMAKAGNVVGVTKAINGGTNGLAARAAGYQQLMSTGGPQVNAAPMAAGAAAAGAASASDGPDPQMVEQTAVMKQIAANTAPNNTKKPDPNGYKPAAATVANGAGA